MGSGGDLPRVFSRITIEDIERLIRQVQEAKLPTDEEYKASLQVQKDVEALSILQIKGEGQ